MNTKVVFSKHVYLDAATFEAMKYLIDHTPLQNDSSVVMHAVKDLAKELGWRQPTPYVDDDQEEEV